MNEKQKKRKKIRKEKQIQRGESATAEDNSENGFLFFHCQNEKKNDFKLPLSAHNISIILVQNRQKM